MTVVISRTQHEALKADVALIKGFLQRFEQPLNGVRDAFIGDSGEFVVVHNYPLPDGYRPDYIQLLLLVEDYPARPPIGLYCLHSDNNSSVIARMKNRFNVFHGTGFHGAPSIPGYTWICNHYADNRWEYNAREPHKGDNLAKFLTDFFFGLEGN